MDDLIRDFLTETTESIGQADNDLVSLEQNPEDGELIGRIFRLVHTVKGTCGFLGLPRLEKVAHAAENVLGRFREKSLAPTEDSIGLVLKAMDSIKTIVAGIEQADGVEHAGDDSALIAHLDALYHGNATPAPAADIAVEPPPAAAPEQIEAAPPSVAVATSEATASVAASAKSAGDAAQTTQPQAAGQSIRVSLDLLEGLMTTVSELVLTRNQLLQALRAQDNPVVQVPLQRLSQIASELQEGIMRTRMQPIGSAWSKLPRLVRDLSVELGKKIDLQMNGAETELDRQVLELIRDPLTHMVRNSADHGLETGAERLAAGKAESGTITLNAYHKGGHIIIEVRDDGRGLPADKIKRKAIQSGILTEAEAAQMSPQQLQALIFRAGFSTAEKVTAVSGRGVGMDVVRTNIERIGGSIELDSREGGGTAFFIKIPLTLAIVSALIVEAAGQRFAIPQIAVSELVLARADQVEEIGGAAVLRLRNRLLPLAKLADTLGIDHPVEAGKNNLIVVAQVYPDKFIPLVERRPLMLPLTLDVAGRALAAAAGLPESVSVAINVPPICLADAHFPDLLMDIASQHRVQPTRITVEITETAAMADPVFTAAQVTRLRIKGVQVSLDDFGTGYASLVELYRMPVSVIKVDRSFVMKLLRDKDAKAIAKAIVRLGSSLDLKVVAEGVENLETLSLLRSWNCDLAQGYHIVRPMPAEALPGWIKSWEEKLSIHTFG